MEKAKLKTGTYKNVMPRVTSQSDTNLKPKYVVTRHQTVASGAKQISSSTISNITSSRFRDLPVALNDYTPEVNSEIVKHRKFVVKPKKTIKSLSPPVPPTILKSRKNARAYYNIYSRSSAPTVRTVSNLETVLNRSSSEVKRLKELKDEIKAYHEKERSLKFSDSLHKKFGLAVGGDGEIVADKGVQVNGRDSQPETSRFLATGSNFHELHREFLIGISTIHYIIKQVCHEIWDCLKPKYMPEKTRDDFKKISDEFYRRTHFPNVIGAVDGKHIQIRKPKQNSSLYYDYKKKYSIILMAICDANYCFTCIDVGTYGGCTDSNVFKKTSFSRQLDSGQIDLPEPSTLPNDPNGRNMPFVLIGNESLALSEHLLRPYPTRSLSVQQRTYNYRLERARRMIECSFSILSNKWKILSRIIELQPNSTMSVVKTCCILHNFVRIKDGFQFDDILFDSPIKSIQPSGLRGSRAGLEIRDYFATYFTSPEGSVPWQNQVIKR